MEQVKNLSLKLSNGDFLTNEELLSLRIALVKLSNLISGCGESFKPFLHICYNNIYTIESYLSARDVVFKTIVNDKKIGVSSKFKYFILNRFENCEKSLSQEDVNDFIKLLIDIEHYAKILGERFLLLGVFSSNLKIELEIKKLRK